jgi:hypothetical protein
MKRIIFLLTSVLLIVMFNLKSQAQSTGVSLNDFAVKSQYLNQDKIYSPNGVSFSANFGFTRTNSDGNPIDVKLVYKQGSTETVISSESVYKGSWSNETSWLSEVSGKLTASQTSGQVYLKFTIYNLNGSVLYNNLSPLGYSITTSNQPSNPSNPEPPTTPGTPPPFTVPVTGSVPLYEFYSTTLNNHFYSTEYKNYGGYVYSRILGYVFTTQEPGTVPLYKYNGAGHHRFSLTLASSIDGFAYSSIACYVYPDQITKTLPVYQHKTSATGDSYFFDGPGTFAGYALEGIKFYILQNPQPTTYALPEEDTMELYEYYSTSKGEHFYTTLKKDRPDYYYSKVLGYVYSIQKPGSVPLHRYVNIITPSGDHYYTLNKQNYNGYSYEGIVGYVYNSSNSGTTAVYEYYNPSVVNHYYNTINSSFAGYSNEGIKFYMLPYNH